MGPGGTYNRYATRMADRKEAEAVVISVEDLARTLIDTDEFLKTNSRGALDVAGVIPYCGTPGRARSCCGSWG